MQPIPVPAVRFSHVHVDLVGPLPAAADGSQYILTTTDHSTRWVKAFPLKAVAASDCAEVLVNDWIARYCVPVCLTLDRGVQFASAVWATLMTRLGVKHVMTTSYHPQSNGVIERFHRWLKDVLRARAAAADLPWVLLGLRLATREDSGVSAADLVFGAPLQLPVQFLSAAEAPLADFVR
jgi:Integrase core domain